jgi:hypothetical protein
MNSFAGIPFSAWTFLKTCSAGLVSGRAWPSEIATVSRQIAVNAILQPGIRVLTVLTPNSSSDFLVVHSAAEEFVFGELGDHFDAGVGDGFYQTTRKSLTHLKVDDEKPEQKIKLADNTGR